MNQLVCAVCDAPLSPTAKFCGKCGSPRAEHVTESVPATVLGDTENPGPRQEDERPPAPASMWASPEDPPATDREPPRVERPEAASTPRPASGHPGPARSSSTGPVDGQGGALASIPPIVAPAVTIGAPVLLLLLSLTKWYDFEGFRASLWQATSGADVALLFLALGTIGASAAVLVTGLGAARLAAGALGLLLAGSAVELIADPVLGGNAFLGSLLGMPVTVALIAGSVLHLAHAAGPSALMSSGGAGVPPLVSILQTGRPPAPGGRADHASTPSASPFGGATTASPFGGPAGAPARSGPEPGWYVDPSGEFAQRRWDGSRWTQDTR